MRSPYFSVEFITDSDEQKDEILEYIQKKYPLYPRSDTNPRITSWDLNPIRDEED